MRWRRCPRLTSCLLAVLVSTVLSLGLAEVVLRVWYKALPSLSPLEGSDYELKIFLWTNPTGDIPAHLDKRAALASCTDSTYLRTRSAPNTRTFSPEDDATGRGAPFQLWVTGDSFTAGVGAASGGGFAELLAGRLARQAGRPVVLSNQGIHGGGYCSAVAAVYERVRGAQPPDAVVLQLLGDDLERRAMLAVGHRPVLPPDRAESEMGRFLVSHSYIANLVWYSVRMRSGQNTVRLVHAKGQQDFVETVRLFKSWHDERGIPLVVVLMAPTGLRQCPPDPSPLSRCAYLPADQKLLTKLLTSSGVPFLDLSDIWEGKPSRVAQMERSSSWIQQNQLGMHPDDQGHRELAEAIWPHLQSALEGCLRKP